MLIHQLALTENFRQLCTIRADLSHLPTAHLTSSRGKKYWEVRVKVVIRFTASEMTAQIAWTEEVRLFSLIPGFYANYCILFSYRGLKRGELLSSLAPLAR
jgi:hypothetical protein